MNWKKYIGVLSIFMFIAAFYTMGKITTVEASKRGNSPRIIRIEPYACGQDVCAGYRCIGDVPLNNGGISVSPACYNSAELSVDNCKNGTYKYIPEFSLACHDTEYYYVWTGK